MIASNSESQKQTSSLWKEQPWLPNEQLLSESRVLKCIKLRANVRQLHFVLLKLATTCSSSRIVSVAFLIFVSIFFTSVVLVSP